MAERQSPPFPSVPAPERLTVVTSERRQKNHLIGVRLDDNEHADLTRLCAQHGLTGPELLRLGLHHFAATETTR